MDAPKFEINEVEVLRSGTTVIRVNAQYFWARPFENGTFQIVPAPGEFYDWAPQEVIDAGTALAKLIRALAPGNKFPYVEIIVG